MVLLLLAAVRAELLVSAELLVAAAELLVKLLVLGALLDRWGGLRQGGPSLSASAG